MKKLLLLVFIFCSGAVFAQVIPEIAVVSPITGVELPITESSVMFPAGLNNTLWTIDLESLVSNIFGAQIVGMMRQSGYDFRNFIAYTEILNFNMTLEFFQNFIMMRYYINGEFADMNIVSMTDYQIILGNQMYIWIEGGKTPLILKLNSDDETIALFYMDLDKRQIASLPVFNKVNDPMLMLLSDEADIDGINDYIDSVNEYLDEYNEYMQHHHHYDGYEYTDQNHDYIMPDSLYDESPYIVPDDFYEYVF